MPGYTEHYNLIKPNKTDFYNINVANTNSDVIDEELYKKVEKIAGKGLSTNDFTNAYKNKLENLKNVTNNNELKNGAGYQNAEQVEDIIGNLVPGIIDDKLLEIKNFIENSMKTLSAEGTSIHVEDSADYACSLRVEGKSEQQQNEVDYPEITMTLDSETGKYYLDGITTQDGTPSPDNVVDFVNTYTAGTYQTTISDKIYVITLNDDLRSVGTTSDRLWLDIEDVKAWVEKNINDEEYKVTSSNGKIGDLVYQYYAIYNLIKTTGITENDIVVKSNVFKGVSRNYSNTEDGRKEEIIFRGMLNNYPIGVNIKASRSGSDTIDGANKILKSIGARVYYILETPQTIDQSCYEWNVPSPNNKIDIENVSGDLEIKVLDTNLFMKQGLSTPTSTENFWYSYTNTSPLNSGWCKVDVNNTGTTTMFANQFLKKGTVDKIKPNTDYVIWAEFRNVKTLNTIDSYILLCGDSNICIWNSNITALLTSISEGKKIIQKVKTKSDISNTTLDLRNFVSVNAGTSITFEYRMMILEDIYTDEELEKITYEEYKEQAVTFPLGEQKLMKDGYLGDDGIHNKRKQIVLTGNENWSKRMNTNNSFNFYINKQSVSGISTHYLSFIAPNEIDTKNGIYLLNTLAIIITDLRFTDVTEFKNWLAEQYTNGTPVIIEYEVEKEEVTPYTEEQQTAYNNLQKLKTYRTVTNISNSQDTNMQLTYKMDLQTQIAGGGSSA